MFSRPYFQNRTKPSATIRHQLNYLYCLFCDQCCTTVMLQLCPSRQVFPWLHIPAALRQLYQVQIQQQEECLEILCSLSKVKKPRFSFEFQFKGQLESWQTLKEGTDTYSFPFHHTCSWNTNFCSPAMRCISVVINHNP